MMRAVPNKHCALDPAGNMAGKTDRCQTFLNLLSQRWLVNLSFDRGRFPDSLKHAVVVPVIKKLSLDLIDFKSYRPVSNMTFNFETFRKNCN